MDIHLTSTFHTNLFVFLKGMCCVEYYLSENVEFFFQRRAIFRFEIYHGTDPRAEIRCTFIVLGRVIRYQKMKTVLTVLRFVALFLTAASATNCDEYSFCEDPGMSMIEGNYQFGQTYGDQSCLATTENAQSFRFDF